MNIEISIKSILFTIGTVIFLLFLGQTLSVWIIVFIAFILSSGIGPILDKMVDKRVRKGLAIPIIFTSLTVILTLLLILSSKPLIDEFSDLAKSLPLIIENIVKSLLNFSPKIIKDYQIDINMIQGQIATNGTTSALKLVNDIILSLGSIFSSFMNLILILSLTSFFLNERGRDTHEKLMIKRALGDKSVRIQGIYRKVQTKLGSWLRGQLTICLLTAIVSFLIYTVLGVRFALPIAIFAFILEAIPVVGGTILGPLGALIAFGVTGNWVIGLAYFVLIALYQLISGTFIVPQIMQKATGLNPIITVIAILIALQFPQIGIFGILITIPLVAVLQIVVEEYFESM